MALTPKQQLFVAEYIKDLNATQAAIRAGYSEDSAHSIGSENLRKPEIAEAIELAMDERARVVGIDANWVLQQAVTLHRRCMQDVVPLMDRKGNQIYDDEGNALFAFNATGAAKALELVGKHVGVGAFDNKLTLQGPDGGPVQVQEIRHTIVRPATTEK